MTMQTMTANGAKGQESTPDYQVREVDAVVARRRTKLSYWGRVADDVLLRMERTAAGRALELTFADDSSALNARIGISKALKNRGLTDMVVRKDHCRVFVMRKMGKVE